MHYLLYLDQMFYFHLTEKNPCVIKYIVTLSHFEIRYRHLFRDNKLTCQHK